MGCTFYVGLNLLTGFGSSRDDVGAEVLREIFALRYNDGAVVIVVNVVEGDITMEIKKRVFRTWWLVDCGVRIVVDVVVGCTGLDIDDSRTR